MNMPHATSSGSSKPLDVLHVITSLETGGAQSMLHKLLATLDPDTFNSTVVSMVGGGAFEQRFKSEGVPVVSLEMERGRPNLAGFRRFVRLLRISRGIKRAAVKSSGAQGS